MPALSIPGAATLATAQPDEAYQLLARVYAAHKVRLHGRVDRFRFWFGDIGLGALSWSVLEHSHASVITEIAPFGHVVAGHILEGAYTCRIGPDEIAASRGDWFMIDPDLPSDMTWSPDVKILTARVDRATLDRLTAGLTGHDPDQPMRYKLASARSGQHARTLDRLLRAEPARQRRGARQPDHPQSGRSAGGGALPGSLPHRPQPARPRTPGSRRPSIAAACPRVHR